jgi:hypothetical protein
MKPDVGVVILNWNNVEDTLVCLNSLRQVEYPLNLIRIIVVDNGSSDGSCEILEQVSDIDLLKLERNRGFAGGNNVGIKYLVEEGFDYILLLNNDTVVDSHFLTPLLNTYALYSDVGIVSPKILYHNPPNVIWYGGGRFHKPRLIGEMIGLNEIDRGQYDDAKKVDFAVGCCMLIRRPILDTVGYLDEDFFFYHEDVDYSYRVTSVGFGVWYQPASHIFHKVYGSTRDDVPLRHYLRARSRVVFFRKHISGMTCYSVLILEIVRLLRIYVNSLLGGNIKTAHSYLLGLRHGLKHNLAGLPGGLTDGG